MKEITTVAEMEKEGYYVTLSIDMANKNVKQICLILKNVHEPAKTYMSFFQGYTIFDTLAPERKVVPEFSKPRELSAHDMQHIKDQLEPRVKEGLKN